jgi:cytochrome P450
VLGHLMPFLRDKLGFLAEAASSASVAELRIGRRTYLPTDPEDIKHVLVSSHRNYDKSPRLTSPRGRRLSGEGLLTSSGIEHLRYRRALQPVFRQGVVDSLAEVAVGSAEEAVRDWARHAKVDVVEEAAKLVQRIRLRTVFSTASAHELDELRADIFTRQRYIAHVFGSLFPFPERVPTRTTGTHRRAIRRLDRFFYAAIEERRRSGAQPPDLLSHLMDARFQDGPALSNKQLRDELLTLALTGFETLGDALCWALYLLGRHPEVRARMELELEETLARRSPAASDVPRLPYAGMVFSEAVRLYPPTWIFVRMARGDDVLPSGARIPAGSKIYLCPYVVHRDPRLYPDPDQFDPGRFSAEAIRARPRFAYFPFGGGPRTCIGERFATTEARLVLATVLQRATLTLAPGQAVSPRPGITLRPAGAVQMDVTAR